MATKKQAAAAAKAEAKKDAEAEAEVAKPGDENFTGNVHVDDPTLMDVTVQNTKLEETEPRIGVPEIHEPTPEALETGRLADRFP